MGEDRWARWTAVAALLLAMGGAAMPEARAGDAEDCRDVLKLIQTEPARVVAACRRLADKGNSYAQNKVGAIYEYGLGVPQDYAQAMTWYRKAADQGFVRAEVNLGNLY